MDAALILYDTNGNEIVNTSTRAVRFKGVIQVSYPNNTGAPPTGSQVILGAGEGELVAFIVAGGTSAAQGPSVSRSGDTVTWTGTNFAFSGTLWVGTF